MQGSSGQMPNAFGYHRHAIQYGPRGDLGDFALRILSIARQEKSRCAMRFIFSSHLHNFRVPQHYDDPGCCRRVEPSGGDERASSTYWY